MTPRLSRLLLLSMFAAGVSSCGLLRAPFTIASTVIEGTYSVGEKMVTAPIDAYDRRQERKEADKAKKEKAAEKAGQQKPVSGGMGQPTPLPEPLPLPETGSLPPIPPPN
jgi:hypothetical protein